MAGKYQKVAIQGLYINREMLNSLCRIDQDFSPVFMCQRYQFLDRIYCARRSR